MLLYEGIKEYCSKFKHPDNLDHYQNLTDGASRYEFLYKLFIRRGQRSKQVLF